MDIDMRARRRKTRDSAAHRAERFSTRRERAGGPVKAGDQSIQLSYKHKLRGRQLTVDE